jgi:hypothetical protein
LYRENGKATYRYRSRWEVKVKRVLEKQAEQKIVYRSVPVEGYYIAVLRYLIIPFGRKTY